MSYLYLILTQTAYKNYLQLKEWVLYQLLFIH